MTLHRVVYLLCFWIVAANRLSSTQENHILDFFRMKSVYISAEIANNTNGNLISIIAKDKEFRVSISQTQIAMLLPVKSASGVRILIHRRSVGKELTNIIVAFENTDVLVYEDCSQIFEESYPDIDFKFDSAILNTIPKWHGLRPPGVKIESGFPVHNKCPNISRKTTEHVFERIERAKLNSGLKSIYFSADVQHATDNFNGCIIDNTAVNVGSSLTENCTTCFCTARNNVECIAERCPHLECSSMVQKEDECCPRCMNSCFSDIDNIEHQHGEVFWPEDCSRCQCYDGVVSCSVEKTKCPKLSCPQADWIQPKTWQCCPKCRDFSNFCQMTPCSADADCINDRHQAKCYCKEGFSGNGTHCFDINECKFADDVKEQLGGCLEGTFCQNTKGSFKCECYPGFQRLSDRICVPLLRI